MNKTWQLDNIRLKLVHHKYRDTFEMCCTKILTKGTKSIAVVVVVDLMGP